jgi:hypothetical protein
MVLKFGEIVEEGTHDYLIEKQGEYYNLVKSQVEIVKTKNITDNISNVDNEETLENNCELITEEIKIDEKEAKKLENKLVKEYQKSAILKTIK